MKKIEAIIRPYKLNAVRNALEDIDVFGMTITEVKGLGRQKGHREIYRGTEYLVDFLPKTKIELLVKDNQLNDTVNTIMEASRTGKIGDGKIIVTSIDSITRIRTGETDQDAV